MLDLLTHSKDLTALRHQNIHINDMSLDPILSKSMQGYRSEFYLYACLL